MRDELSTCTPPSTPSPIALCLAGQLRTLTFSWMQHSLQHAVIAAVRPHAFLHVSREFESRQNATTHDLELITNLVQPVCLHVLSDEQVLNAVGSSVAASTAATGSRLQEGGIRGTLALRWEACLHDIAWAEAAVGKAYSYVVRARPDVRWGCVLPPLASWPAPTALTPPLLNWDFVAVMPRALADAVLSLRRRTTLRAAPCSRPVFEHDRCLDTLLHEKGVAACELLPRARITRFSRPHARGDPWPPSPPPNRSCPLWSAPAACVASARLLRPCASSRFHGFWRCQGQAMRPEWRLQDQRLIEAATAEVEEACFPCH